MMVDMVADMEVDKVMDKVADMVADMEVDKVVDMVFNMVVYWSSAWVTPLECPKGAKDEFKQARRAQSRQLYVSSSLSSRASRVIIVSAWSQRVLWRCSLFKMSFFLFVFLSDPCAHGVRSSGRLVCLSMSIPHFFFI